MFSALIVDSHGMVYWSKWSKSFFSTFLTWPDSPGSRQDIDGRQRQPSPRLAPLALPCFWLPLIRIRLNPPMLGFWVQSAQGSMREALWRLDMQPHPSPILTTPCGTVRCSYISTLNSPAPWPKPISVYRSPNTMWLHESIVINLAKAHQASLHVRHYCTLRVKQWAEADSVFILWASYCGCSKKLVLTWWSSQTNAKFQWCVKCAQDQKSCHYWVTWLHVETEVSFPEMRIQPRFWRVGRSNQMSRRKNS